MEDVIRLAKDLGLDFFPVIFETVEALTMHNICSYGLPTRARHWSYGRSYDHQKTYGEMGFSKIYEVILNNNPSYAFMMDTNSEVQNLFITAHCCGHCFVPGTLVETDDGPKPIEKITIKDRVLTHTGKYRNPMALSKRAYSGNLINIKIGSQNIQCTPEHPFLIVKHEKCTLDYRTSVCKNSCKYKNQKRCGEKPYKEYESEWVKAKDIKEKDFVLFPKNNNIDFITTHINIVGTKGLGHPGGEKEVSYKIEMNEEFGEFLGLFVAEGYAREGGQMGLCFHTSEVKLHERSKYLINKLFGLKTFDYISEETHSHQILFNEKVLSNWLRINCGSSCYDKHIPFKLPSQCAKAFLRGVFHGDGHNAIRNVDLTTTSIKLASQVRNICLDYNIKTNIKIRNQKDRHEAYVVIISGESLTKFAKETNIDWGINNGNRNYEFSWFDDDYMYTPVTEVCEFKGKTCVYNLEVPEDSSYVLFAGAVTHNSDFFKNNCMFQSTDRNMISHAAEHAGRIEEYINRYGFERVERIMDIGFALDSHIDWHKGLHRKRYPKRRVMKRKVVQGEFDDLLKRNQKLVKPVKMATNKRIPPHPEKDLLWFLINYAPLEDWERDVLDIIREEAHYFYPQKMTKIMNEGWASYWHAEIMYQYDGLSASEYMDFVRDHEKVVQPGANPFRINPYFLGFKIFKDIEKRWDEKYGKGAGRKKIFEVRKEEDDISFLRNYLTADLVQDLKLFTYGYVKDYPDDYNDVKYIEIKEKMAEDITEAMVKPLYNGGAPKIVVDEIGQEGSLILKHKSEEMGTLNKRFAEKTIEYIWDLWAAPIELHTLDDDGEEVVLFFDEAGFHVRDLNEELDFDDEEEDESDSKRSGGKIIIP